MNFPIVKVVFDRRNQSTKNRPASVMIEVYFDRKRKWISTGVKVCSNEWHPSRWVVRRLDADILNSRIRSRVEQIQSWINDVQRSKEPFSLSRLGTYITNHSMSGESFISYIETRIEERYDIRESTKKTHRKLINALMSFKKISQFSDLSKDNILAFDKWLHKKGIIQTSIYGYHKTLKAYINDAIKREMVQYNPYTTVKIDKGKSASRKFLTIKELKAVISAKLVTKTLEYTRDLFLFQCFTGLSYADMCKFGMGKIVERNGKYIYHGVRQKTDEDFNIVLLSPAVKILQKYKNKLPITSNQKYNVNLKILATNAGIDHPITSHMGRHTFAVYCLNNGISIEVLAKMMGHTDIKTTQIYARIINESVYNAAEQLEDKITGMGIL